MAPVGSSPPARGTPLVAVHAQTTTTIWLSRFIPARAGNTATDLPARGTSPPTIQIDEPSPDGSSPPARGTLTHVRRTSSGSCPRGE